MAASRTFSPYFNVLSRRLLLAFAPCNLIPARYRSSIFVISPEKPHIHMHRRHIDARVQHQRHPHCLKGAAGQLGSVGSSRRRQGIAHHMRKIDTAALE